MNTSNYTEKEIAWAIEELKKKGVLEPTHEQAVKLLETFKEFGKVVVDKMKEVKEKKTS
ncbi:MAG: hypothetical protein V1858_01300 [Candidatus Gottesmanbacteria bacterium]